MYFKKLKTAAIYLALISFCTEFKSFAINISPSTLVQQEESTLNIFEKLNTKLNMNLTFINQNGKKETLKEILNDNKILILTLNYFSCTTMCTFQFMNLSKSLNKMNWPIGKGFKIATISFDPKDTVNNAKLLQKTWVPKTGQDNAQWNFYVSDKKNIESITQQLNFYYAPDAEGETYSHAGALYFIKPDGTFYRYLYGIVYEPEDIKHALIESSNGTLGTFFEKLPLKFKKYQPNFGKYTKN
ncbi:SCO family protein [Fluviispira multicolorata]|nr:SCO family protein [Fluviispira multicolorata]